MQFDRIGYWSQVKLEIIREYAQAYSLILAKQPFLYHVYIDAFAGAGVHRQKNDEGLVTGSPLNALAITPRFREYFFIDLNAEKVDHLRDSVGDRDDVHFYAGDCNRVLLESVFPQVRYEDYRRALCLLDPYGLHLDWNVILSAGQMKSVDIFLNFPVMDMNRNVFWRNPSGVDPAQIERMNAFWGDSSWHEVVYESQVNLFGDEYAIKRPQKEIVQAFEARLRQVAGFERVPPAIPMRNSIGAVVYYLFFASNNPAGERIARYVMKKYEHWTPEE